MRSVLLGLGLVFLTAGPAAADLAAGADALTRGDYKQAIGELARTKGPDAGKAKLLLVDAQLTVGDLKGAEATATAASKDADAVVASNGKVALADVLRATGRNADAQKLLEALVAADPGHRPARRALARLLMATGKLPFTWQRTVAQLPFDFTALPADGPAAPLFPAGFGLSIEQ